MSIQFDYFYGSEAEQYTFYRIPKILFKDKIFKDVSAEAKVLYGLMLDRMGLSIKNRWVDEENRVYIIYTIADIISYISYAQIGGCILACDEIADYSDLKLNNDTQNITVSETQVPVLGVVTVA